MDHKNDMRRLLLVGKLPKVSAPSDASRPPLSQPNRRAEKAAAERVVDTTPAPYNLNLHTSAGGSAQFSSLIPALMTLKGQMMQELEEHVTRLLSLNPSRREAIAQYLDRLASQNSAPSSSQGIGDAAGGLRRWVEGPRSQAQNSALRAYFEEIALIFLGQAILLKAWSDAGFRRIGEADIGKLNWVLSTALKPHVPVDRDGWQFTRPNLYSWYTPSPAIQHQLWLTIDQTRISDEGPNLILSIAGPARQARPDAWIPHGYDARFFKAIWNIMPGLGFDLSNDNGPIRHHRIGFSPTLRDGTMVRTGPSSLSWVGLELSPFQLMISELMQLWWGPQVPPLWSIGSGLEVHTRDQLQLALSSPKPSLLTRIAEMEACDIAFVNEERVIKSQSRSAEASRFREQLDSLPYFKKLKSSGTSLGDLQACVALSKLRPGGLLWWAREEPLSQQDGSEVLSFLLDRAKLICEWDLSNLEHALPVSLPLFPKYLYLFARESDVEARLSHRPARVSLSGQIRSHIEVPVVLEDMLLRSTQSRGQWQIHIQTSPTAQKDWSDRWPDLASQNTIRVLDRLRSASVPLANVSTVRSAPETPIGEFHGIWIQESGRKLKAALQPEAGSGGFLIFVPDSSWIAPLCSYLRSDTVRDWLDHHAERRGDRWVLNEQVVRWIPIPKLLLAELGYTGADLDRAEIPPSWRDLIALVKLDPAAAQLALSQMAKDESTLPLRTAVYVQAAQSLETLSTGKKNLLSIVSEDGRLAWNSLFEILPRNDFIPITTHPRVDVKGGLPLHLPISKIERVKSPVTGIMLATEIGMSAMLTSDSSMILDMLWEQLENAKHPTWSELVQSLRLPRRIEVAQSAAEDVLKSHAEVSSRILVLRELLSDCSVY